MSLSDLKPGQTAVVDSIGAEPLLSARLRDFGLVEGTRVQCRLLSPDGLLMAVCLRATVLAIRRRDAALIKVLV